MIKHFEKEYRAGNMQLEYIRQVLASWIGRAERANAPYLREEVPDLTVRHNLVLRGLAALAKTLR